MNGADSHSSIILDPHEGVASVTVTGEWEVARLVSEPLGATILRLGVPAVASMLLMTLFFTVDAFWIGRYLGATALAAVSTAVFWIWIVVSIAEMVGIGLTAAAAIVGQNLGAGERRRAARTGWITLGYVTIPALVVTVLELAAAPRLAGVFTTDALTVARGAEYRRIAALGNVFLGAEVILEAALGGAGATLPPMVASTSLTALRVPLAAACAARYGVVGIWWVITVTAALRGVAMAGLWTSGFWHRRRV